MRSTAAKMANTPEPRLSLDRTQAELMIGPLTASLRAAEMARDAAAPGVTRQTVEQHIRELAKLIEVVQAFLTE